MNGYLPSKIVKIMYEALDLIKKIQEDTALGYGARISSEIIYLDVCRGKKRKTQPNLFLLFFLVRLLFSPNSPFLALTFFYVCFF